MGFRLPRLPGSQPPWKTFQLWWQRVIEAIETQEASQDATINRIRRIMSHTTPTTILSAIDNGTSCTATVLAHTRVYADATTLSIVQSSPYPGLTSDTWYACYYDDLTLADTTPAYVFTINVEDAQSATADGRHFCGLIKTPVAASGETIASGGSYPVGAAAVGGELM
jgi:hypothetical protein